MHHLTTPWPSSQSSRLPALLTPLSCPSEGSLPRAAVVSHDQYVLALSTRSLCVPRIARQVSSLVLPSICAPEPVTHPLSSPRALRTSLPTADIHLALKHVLALARSRCVLGCLLSHVVPPLSCITFPLAPQTPSRPRGGLPLLMLPLPLQRPDLTVRV